MTFLQPSLLPRTPKSWKGFLKALLLSSCCGGLVACSSEAREKAEDKPSPEAAAVAQKTTGPRSTNKAIEETEKESSQNGPYQISEFGLRIDMAEGTKSQYSGSATLVVLATPTIADPTINIHTPSEYEATTLEKHLKGIPGSPTDIEAKEIESGWELTYTTQNTLKTPPTPIYSVAIRKEIAGVMYNCSASSGDKTKISYLMRTCRSLRK